MSWEGQISCDTWQAADRVLFLFSARGGMLGWCRPEIRHNLTCVLK